MGIVQGITEFFPVSSDGHLVLAEYLVGFHEQGLLYDVLLHFGTLGSLVVVYRKEVLELIQDCIRVLKRCFEAGLKEGILSSDRWTLSILITTFVTGVSGIILEKTIEDLSSSTMAAGWGFLVTAVFLFVANYRGAFAKKNIREMPLHFAVSIGLAQALALFPGISRSGSTICLALILGLRREEAGRYSFVAAIPIIFLATLYELRKAFTEQVEHWDFMLLGMLTSFVVGFLAIRLLILMLTRLALWPFAVYTLFAAALAFAASFGWI